MTQKETMSPLERWQAVLNRQQPDRVPMDYWGTIEATRNVCRYLECDEEEMFKLLHIDRPLDVGPRCPEPREPDTDMFGCKFKMMDYGTGAYRECINAPLAKYVSVDEIEADYTWPDVDEFRYDHLPAMVKGKEHMPVRFAASEPFLVYKQLRGDAQAFMDLLLNPDIVKYCLDKLFGMCYENTRRILETIPGRVTFAYVAEDLGSQTGLLFALEHIREYLLPHMKRMMDLVHEGGVLVMTHSDGAIREVIPDLIEIGADILNPIQWRCAGMNREGLKRDFGDKLIFHGAVDNQQTLPFGTVEDVRQEVRDNLRILGDGGGYILGPCHNHQAVTPPENIVAMYEEGYESGWL